jgi:hypothetical protein
VRMDRACGLERKDRVYASCRHLALVLRMNPLGHMGRVYGRCVHMDLVCGLQEDIGVAAAVGKGRYSRSERIRRILLDYCLQVSDTLQMSRVNSQES